MKKKIVLMAALIVALLYGHAVLKDNAKAVAMSKRFTTVLKDQDVNCLTLDNRYVYAGCGNGVFKVDLGTLQTEKIADCTYVKAILIDGDKLWIGHENGLTCLTGDERIVYTTEDGLPDNRINALFLDSNARLWVGSWGGASIFSEGDFTTYSSADGLTDDMVNVIAEDSYGDIWIASYVAPRGGVAIKNGSAWQRFTTSDGLVHANVNAILEDSKRRVIVAGGLYHSGGGTCFQRVDGKWRIVQTLDMRDGLAGEKIRSLFIDSKKRFWIGSEYDGLVVFDGEGRTYLDVESGLNSNEVKAISEDRNGDIWIATKRGLTIVEKEALYAQ